MTLEDISSLAGMVSASLDGDCSKKTQCGSGFFHTHPFQKHPD